MKSIFEIQDGDAVDEWYRIPGYQLTLRQCVSSAGTFYMEVHDGRGFHEHLTKGLRQFDREARNRNTMLKVGLWLQREAGRIGVPTDLSSLTISDQAWKVEKPITIQVQFTESAADRVRRACVELGWTLESAKANVFEDALEVSGVTRTGERFEARLSGKLCRRDELMELCDALECPLCGARVKAPHRVGDTSGSLFRTVCGDCGQREGGSHARADALNAIGALAAIHAWPTPVRDMVDARIAEQVSAGGVDCDATREAVSAKLPTHIEITGFTVTVAE